MNYPYQIPGIQTSPGVFVADQTGVLGSITKSQLDEIQIKIDYSQLTPSMGTLKLSAIRVCPGGFPELVISPTPISAFQFMFYILGGIAGRTYTATITMNGTGSGTRSDVLTINVNDDGCC